MAYTITYSGGTFTIADGVLNTANTSLSLPGRNYAGYGAPVNQDLVSLLENFASSSSGPTNAIKGQLWFDTAGGNVLKVNLVNGTPNWQPLAISNANANSTFGNLNVTFGITGNTANFTGNVTTSAGFFSTSVSPSLAAAGTDQTGATQVTRGFSVVSSGTGGIRLPAASVGTMLYITNISGGNVNVYPASGAQINNLSLNTPFVMGTGATIHFVASTATQWYTTGATYA